MPAHYYFLVSNLCPKQENLAHFSTSLSLMYPEDSIYVAFKDTRRLCSLFSVHYEKQSLDKGMLLLNHFLSNMYRIRKVSRAWDNDFPPRDPTYIPESR